MITQSDTQIALQVQGLTLQLGERVLFSDLSFQVPPGGRLIINGISGSGKSTLMKLLLGFIWPFTGEVRIGDTVMTGHSIWPLRASMVWIPQEPDLGDGTVREHLERVGHYHVNRNLNTSQRLPELLDRLQIATNLLDQPVSLLSGGEKQRVAIMTALLLQRPLLLLDEATSALDRSLKQNIVNLIAEQNCTQVVISHDPEWDSLPDTDTLNLSRLL